jgi:ABC-type amino acid transport substrate-binding protein
MKRLAVLWLFLLCSSMAAAEELLVFGGDGFGPFAYLKDGKADGIMPKMLRRAGEISGDTYDIQLMPWKRAYLKAEKGEGGIFGLSYTPDRVKLFDYSQSMYDNDVKIVTLASNTFSFKRLADLKGKAMGGLHGVSYGEEVDAAVANGVFTVERDSQTDSRLLKLLYGRIDAALVDGGQVGLDNAFASNDEVRKNFAKFVVLPTALVHDPLHLAFPKNLGKRAAIERFNAALSKMRKSGEMKNFFGEVKIVSP